MSERSPAWDMVHADRAYRVLCLVKGSERYVFLFADDMLHRSECLSQLGRFASNPELSFTWYDAAMLSQRIRHQPETEANHE